MPRSDWHKTQFFLHFPGECYCIQPFTVRILLQTVSLAFIYHFVLHLGDVVWLHLTNHS